MLEPYFPSKTLPLKTPLLWDHKPYTRQCTFYLSPLLHKNLFTIQNASAFLSGCNPCNCSPELLAQNILLIETYWKQESPEPTVCYLTIMRALPILTNKNTWTSIAALCSLMRANFWRVRNPRMQDWTSRAAEETCKKAWRNSHPRMYFWIEIAAAVSLLIEYILRAKQPA